MAFYDNKNHFLHKHLTFLESIGRQGKNDGFSLLLKEIGIEANGIDWNIDHSTIDWTDTENFHQFFFDYEGNTDQIKKWLWDSPISNYDTLYTWLSWEDPIIKVKVKDFIEHWDDFNLATGWQGLIISTVDGKFFLEFTDDWKYHLNSNFQIKPNSRISKL